jgi:hypothetical protein
MFRLDIGTRPPPGDSQLVPVGQSGAWQSLDGDPFGEKPKAEPKAESKGPEKITGAELLERAWNALDLDPFLEALTGPAEKPPVPDAVPGVSMYGQGSRPSAVWQDEPGYFPGAFGTSRLAPSVEAIPEPPVMGSRTGTPKTQPAPWFGSLDLTAPPGGFAGADQISPVTTTSWADRASQLIDNAPIGTARVPDKDPMGPAAVSAERQRVMNTPYTPQQGDGTTVGNPTPGVVAYEPSSGDQLGGHASNMALAKASTIPLTSAENLHKRILIYAQDLGVPPNRFFTDKADPSQIKYVDFKGQVFSVAPTIGGGDLWNAPVDMAQRVIGQSANNAAPLATTAISGAAGMVTGPEFYGPTAALMAGATGFAGDVAAQAGGNWFAEQAGYQRPDPEGGPDIAWGHAALTGVEMAGFEALARVAPQILYSLFPGGANPYKLTGSQAQDLARVIHDDERFGGEILRRARTSTELGLNLSPAQLLQVTKGTGSHGGDSGHINMRSRLYSLFAEKEAILSSGGNTKRGKEASQFMRERNVDQVRNQFPNAVQRVLDEISPVDSPVVGFREFQKASGRVEQFLAGRAVAAGEVDPLPLIRHLRQTPLAQERLGGALADSGPETVAAARRAFEEAGELDAWNAHTRAYLDTSLRGAHGGSGMHGSGGTGYDAGLRFANDVAGRPQARAGLLEMVTDEHQRGLLESLVDAGFAIEQSGATLARPGPTKAAARNLNGKGTMRLGEKLAALLTPLQSMRNGSRTFQEWRDMRGARDMAFEMSLPSMKQYNEMRHPVVPLAGRGAEVLERSIFAGAPVVEEQTDAIPRLSPLWLMKMLAPHLIAPPARDATAPDLAPAAQRRMYGLLGPAP